MRAIPSLPTNQQAMRSTRRVVWFGSDFLAGPKEEPASGGLRLGHFLSARVESAYGRLSR